MKRIACLILIVSLIAIAGYLAACASKSSTPVPAPTSTPGSPTHTPAPSSTPSPPTQTPTPTATPTPPTPGIGSTLISDVDGMVMVFVPAGEFLMGSTADDSQANRDEKPQHTVYLDAFWIDRTEVTNAMYARYVAATGYQTEAEREGWSLVFMPSSGLWEKIDGADWRHPRGPSTSLSGLENHPVGHLSWGEAGDYCAWAGRRLPTEAEWEKAARGTDGRIYPWGDQAVAGTRLNFADRNLDVPWADPNMDDGYEFDAPAGHYPSGASPYGALDMVGNMWEWVADWYDINYYARSPAQSPLGPASGKVRVLRGGAWYVGAQDARAAVRDWVEPDVRYDLYGFRCVFSP